MIIIKGKAEWAKIHTPDTKFNPDGDFSINVIMSEEEAAPIEEKLQELLDVYVEELLKENPKIKNTLRKADVLSREVDENGDETGNVVFKCKRKAKIHSKKSGKTYEQRVTVVDSKKKPTTVDVGNGSIVKVAVDPSPYYVAATKMSGMSLRLQAVQIIDLVEYKGSAASVFDEEEGYIEENTDNSPFDTNEEDF